MNRFLLLFFCFLSFASHANSSLTFFGKVLKVDGHNVMHVGINGQYRYLTLAYLMTPVKDEPYAQEVNAFMREQLVGEWLMFTRVAYGKEQRVMPVIIRMKDKSAFNMTMLRKGLAVVNLSTNPPVQMIDNQITAKNASIGLWSIPEKFDVYRGLKGTYRSKQFTQSDQELKDYMMDKENPIRGFILQADTKKAYELICMLSNTPYDKMAYTIHSVKAQGYTIEEGCPQSTSRSSEP